MSSIIGIQTIWEAILTEAKVLGINFESLVDGEGVRVTVFFSGCKHYCEGCHNPLSHDFQNGRPFTDQIQNDLIDYIRSTPFIDGITLSGGDPMYSASSITPFVRRIKNDICDKKVTIWIYSGFTYEEICKHTEMFELMALCDVLVDGPFIAKYKGLNLPYKGSSNQRIIDIQASIEADAAVVLNGGF